MKKAFLVLALLSGLSAPRALVATERSDTAKPAASPAPDDAWLAKAKAEYPLNTCVVSHEEFGEMGHAIDYVYLQPGQPDRLVRFCCKDCRKDFDKDPAKYLKLIDEAATKAKKS